MVSSPPLTVDRAEQLIRLMTDGLVNIVDKTGEFLLRLEDGSVIDTKGWGGWEWTHGIALTALYRHAALSPSSPSNHYSLQTALDWFRAQYRATIGKGVPKNINTMAPFYCLACAVEENMVPEEEREQWVGWLVEWAEWIMHDLPRTKENGFQHMTYANMHKDNLWDDTLMMTVVPLAKIGKLLGKQEYIDEAIYQFLLHVQYLMDPVSGLWYHGWEFTPGAKTGSGNNFAGALWARGNCWITVSIPLFIQILQLEPIDPIYRFLASTLKRQLDALVPLIDTQTGLFHTLLLDPSSYVETSASAGFAVGIYMAIQMGIVPTTYQTTADSALQGVLAQIQPDGEVANVSFGTGMGSSLQFYKDIKITSMPYGQALAMWALVEWESLQRASRGV